MKKCFIALLCGALVSGCEQSWREYFYLDMEAPPVNGNPIPDPEPDPGPDPEPDPDPGGSDPEPDPTPDPDPDPLPAGFHAPKDLEISAPTQAGFTPQHIEVKFTKGTGTPNYECTVLIEDGEIVDCIPPLGGPSPYIMVFPEARPPGAHRYSVHSRSEDGKIWPGTEPVEYTVPEPVAILWDAPTTNADGTPLTDLARYAILVNGVQQQTSTATKAILNPPPEPGATVTVRAVDTAGNESKDSNAVAIPSPD